VKRKRKPETTNEYLLQVFAFEWQKRQENSRIKGGIQSNSWNQNLSQNYTNPTYIIIRYEIKKVRVEQRQKSLAAGDYSPNNIIQWWIYWNKSRLQLVRKTLNLKWNRISFKFADTQEDYI